MSETEESAPAKNLGGRPTKYKPEYCEQIVEMMAEGYSMTAFAGHIRVARSTIEEWAAQHVEFREAVAIGKAARTLLGEKEILAAPMNVNSGYVVSRIFMLKNFAPEEWRDKREHGFTNREGEDVAMKVEFVGIAEPDEDQPS